MPISFPRLGTALADISGVTELRALRVLKLSGGPTPSVACIEVGAGGRLCVGAPGGSCAGP